MESGYRMEYLTHFAHPQHPLVKSQYDPSLSRRFCHICEAQIAGLGYRCSTCDNFDIHEACATYFKESISFFAHPWHALTLAHTIDGRECDLCREQCRVGTFMYSCARCAFDVHPLCTLLPQTIRSPLHPAHELNMVPAKGDCAACRRDCSVWHYRCGLCLYMLHIGCDVSGAPPGGGDHSNTTGRRGWGTAQATGGASRIGRFLLMAASRVAEQVAANVMGHEVLDALHAAGLDWGDN